MKAYQLLEEGLVIAHLYDITQFTPNGVAGIFAVYTLPGANLRDTFMNEFFAVCNKLSLQHPTVIIVFYLVVL